MVPIESSYTTSYQDHSYRQVLRIKSGIYESARNLYRGCRAVPLQTFTTRHSNHKLSIVIALSTTFTQCAQKGTNSVKITQNKGHFAVQGHSRSSILVQPLFLSYFLLWRSPRVCCRPSTLRHVHHTSQYSYLFSFPRPPPLRR